MVPPLLFRSSVLAAALLLAGGCQRPDISIETYVSGLRILGIKAEPPEVPPGQTSTLTALVVDTQGRTIDGAWAYCENTPPAGSRINNDCILNDTASYLYPLNPGLSTTIVMPTVDPMVLGMADPTGGVYLPIRGKFTAGTDSAIAVYSLRVGMGSPPNQNPSIVGIYQVMPGAGNGPDGGGPVDGGPDGGSFSDGSELLTPIDPVTPMIVHSGDKIILRAIFSATSAETYSAPGRPTDGGTGMPRMATERLNVVWFSTAGTIRPGMTGGPPPDSVLTIEGNLPSSGSTIDLWAVGRDGRGGLDYQHRTLSFQ